MDLVPLVAMFVVPIAIGVVVGSGLKAAIYSVIISIVVSTLVPIWHQSFFPYDGSAAEMAESLSLGRQGQIEAWVLRSARRAIITGFIGGTIGWLVGLRVRKAQKTGETQS
jgi:uncharacterized membrane protein YhiD involved in acid resistance